MLTIGIILIVVWFLGFVLLKKVLGAIIHLVLLIAIGLVIWHFAAPYLK